MSLVTGLFFLVLLLNQRWSPSLRLQASHCSASRNMCDVPSIIIIIIIIIVSRKQKRRKLSRRVTKVTSKWSRVSDLTGSNVTECLNKWCSNDVPRVGPRQQQFTEGCLTAHLQHEIKWNGTAPSAPYTRPTQRLSGPLPIYKLGAENHTLQLNI